MIISKIRICIFIHYSVSESLPYYVKVYIEELSRHFDKVKVLTNNSKIQESNVLFNKNVDFKYNKNQGYDFGMFYRYIISKNLDDYSEIALINDSNILLNRLDTVFNWGRKNDSDFWGMIDSHEKPWFSSHKNNYHLQGHFLVFKNNAINKLIPFLELLDVEEILEEQNTKKLRRLVIDKWEIGLSRYFIEQDLKSDSFIKHEDIRVKYRPKKQNLTHSLFHELASEGYPLLKRKVIFGKRKLFKPSDNNWKKTIQDFGNSEWDMVKMVNAQQ